MFRISGPEQIKPEGLTHPMPGLLSPGQSDKNLPQARRADTLLAVAFPSRHLAYWTTMSTHQQLLYHIVYSTKNRKPYLQNNEFRDSVFAYKAGVVKNLGGSAIKIGGYFDHVHLLIRIPATIAVSKFTGELKANTSKHINETSEKILKFGWQDGYGAFTVSPSLLSRVKTYIENQLEHHSSQSFEDEYIRLLNKHEIDFDRKYVFD